MKLTFPVTKERIRNHFAYAWWQYVLLICLAIFGWNLLYTTTRYRSPNDQRLEWFYSGYQMDGEKDIDALMDELHQSLFPNVEEVTFRTLMLDDTYGSMQLTVWVSAGEGDLFMLNSEYFNSIAQSEAFVELTPYIEDGTQQWVTAETSRQLRSYVEHHPDRRMVELQAHPLPIPDKVDSWLVAEVC